MGKETPSMSLWPGLPCRALTAAQPVCLGPEAALPFPSQGLVLAAMTRLQTEPETPRVSQHTAHHPAAPGGVSMDSFPLSTVVWVTGTHPQPCGVSLSAEPRVASRPQHIPEDLSMFRPQNTSH